MRAKDPLRGLPPTQQTPLKAPVNPATQRKPCHSLSRECQIRPDLRLDTLMKRPSTRRRGIARIATTLVLGPVALTAAGVLASPQNLCDLLGVEPSSTGSLLELHALIRHLLEFAIVLFQLVSVAAFCLWKLAASGRWANSGRNAFVAAMIGLGVGGALCAGYCSAFALYAGGTMAFWLVMNGLGSESNAVNPFRPDRVPVMMGK